MDDNSREIRQQELARLLLQKARQDLDLVVNVAGTETVADEIMFSKPSKNRSNRP